MTVTHSVSDHSVRHPLAALRHGAASLTHMFAVAGRSFANAIEAGREYDRLSRMSDRQLAAEGLKREDISQRVIKTLGV